MRAVLSIVVLLAWATGLWAQNAGDSAETARDRGLLQGFIEDNLSDAGREVRIEGFAGALSSQATLDEMTIADDQGVWLTLRGVTLDWTRSALLRGRLEVDRLTAEEILLPRLPQTEGGVETEDAVAQPFALPDLPVSVQIGELRADKVALGAPILGEAADFSAEGALSLAGGAGHATLTIERLERNDTFTLEAEYSNETRILALDLDLTEDQGGILSGVLNLPERPALGLRVTGEGPIDAYEARVALTRNGVRRLGGTVSTEAVSQTPEATDTQDAVARRFAARLGGDIRPFFTSELRRFFGGRSRLELNGWRTVGGGTVLEEMTLQTAQLQLSGGLELDSRGWPVRFDLDGSLGGDGLVRLPVSGPPLRLETAQISAAYDAALGETWRATAQVVGLQQEGLRLLHAQLSGDGRIVLEGVRQVSGNMDFALSGLQHDDPALAQAIGPAPEGRTQFSWRDGEPLHISNLALSSGDLTLSATGDVDGLADGFPVLGNATLQAGDLTRFAAISKRDLAGSAEANLSGTAAILGGAFDLNLDATTNALAIGEPRLDRLLAPETRLNIAVQRDETGTALKRLSVDSSAVEALISGQLDETSGTLNVDARLSDVSLVEPRLTGPASVTGDIGWTQSGGLTLTGLNAQVADATLTATGQLDPADPALPVNGTATLEAADLARFARLAGRPLAGQLSLQATGEGAVKGDTAMIDATLNGQNLRSGIAALDSLLTGTVSARLDASRSDGMIDLRTLRLDTPRLTVDADGSGADAPIQITARLANLGLLADGLDGPAEARGTVRLRDDMGRNIAVDLNASGPGGTVAQVSGTIRDHGQSLDLTMNGNAPLALANRFIAPRSASGMARFDLRIAGAPTLSSASGRITLSDGRVALPSLSMAFANMNGTIDLTGERANLQISADGREGGSVLLRGPINLAAPYPADLSILLNALRQSDPDLYTTQVSGMVTVNGPLLGGARISGQLQLGETEIRVPSSTIASVGLLPQIRHVGEPSEVTTTRRRAGLIQEEEPAAGPALALDLTISAPNRIFVRGRGLDAELGGRIRVTGTTNDVVPSGMFELIRGRLDILGKRLTLDEGRIDLRGAFDPYLRFVASTESEDATLRVVIEGLASAPEITFASTPDLPQEEVVARLIFGRGLDKISAFQAAQLAAAVATLAGRMDDGLLGGLRESVGLSNLDVTTADDGSTQLSAGAYVSENIYSEISADSEGNQQIDLNLDLSRSVTVKGRLDSEGSTGIGIYFEKDY